MIIKVVIHILLILFISMHIAYSQKQIDYKILSNCYNNRVQVGGNNGTVGYVDINGDIVVPLKYSKIPSNVCLSSYKEGYTVVCNKGQQYGWIDTIGNRLDKNKYIYCSSFSNGTALAIKKRKLRFRNYYVQIVLDSNKVVTYKRYKRKRYISTCMYYKFEDLVNSKEELIPIYKETDSIVGYHIKNDIISYKDHYISLYNSLIGRWGLFDEKGEMVVGFVSNSIIITYMDIAVVKNEDIRIYNLRTQSFYPGKYTTFVEKDDFIIFMDQNGKYDVYSPFEGFIEAKKEQPPIVGCIKDVTTDKYGYFSMSGKVLDCNYDNYIRYNEEGYAMVLKDGITRIINIKGEELLIER